MKKAKIYKPTKSAMQSGKRNTKNWLLEFDTLNTGINPLTGWETSRDTMSEVKLEFSTKEEAINYAKKSNIDYYIAEPQKPFSRIKKSKHLFSKIIRVRFFYNFSFFWNYYFKFNFIFICIFNSQFFSRKL